MLENQSHAQYPRRALKQILEPHIYQALGRPEYTIKRQNPRYLLTSNRFDIFLKYSYLSLASRGISSALCYYKHDIRSQTNGHYQEYQNNEKNNFDKYVDSFSKIDQAIGKDGFDPSTSIIPLSNTGSILNGAHRLTSALFRRKPVWTVQTELKPLSCDYKYFTDRAVPEHILKSAMDMSRGALNNLYVAFLWPSGKRNWEESQQLIPNKYLIFDIQLTSNGGLNLLYQCYKHMDWIGVKEKHFPGLRLKRSECFPNDQVVRCIIFRCSEGIHKVRMAKAKIRAVNNIGYSSVHITDNDQETSSLLDIVLNSNGIEFLNCTYPGVTHTRDARLVRDYSISNGIQSTFAIDGSYLLGLIGVREPNDIDIVASDELNRTAIPNTSPRDEQSMQYHAVNSMDLIYNPEYHFKFDGLKIVSLRQLLTFKTNRNEEKDQYDAQQIARKLQPSKRSTIRASVCQRIIYTKIFYKDRVFKIIIEILDRTGLRRPVSFIRNKIRR